MDDFILPRLQGGLGNQLFQVAACFAIQQQQQQQQTNQPQKDIKILIPSCSTNPHKRSKTAYEALFLQLPNTSRIELPANILQTWETFTTAAANLGIPFQSQRGGSYSSWAPSEFTVPCFLEGYFQFWPPFEPIWKEFAQLMLNGLPNIPSIPSIPNVTTCEGDTSHVFIHVRRGDYVPLSHHHYLQDESYYKNALQHFPRDTKFLIFSDDIEFAKSCGFFDAVSNKIFVNEPDEVNALAIMSRMCHGGAICANSTFSYWGALLGPYYHRDGGDTKQVNIIVPSKWCASAPEFLFPEDWIVL